MIILNYHRIAEDYCDPWALSVAPKNFAEQLEVLAKWTRVVPLRSVSAAVAKGIIPERCIAITFDDGYADNVTVALPLLEQHELCATFFVVSDCVGAREEFWWDELERLLLQPGFLPNTFEMHINGSAVLQDLSDANSYSFDTYLLNRSWRAWQKPPTARHSLYFTLWQTLHSLSSDMNKQTLSKIRTWANVKLDVRKNRETLSESQLTGLGEHALIEVGCHTVTHPRLSLLSVAAQESQIQDCRHFLEQRVGNKVTSFAYPYGSRTDYSKETVGLLQECKFSTACSSVPLPVTPESDPFQLPRITVENWDGEEFSQKLSEWFHES